MHYTDKLPPVELLSEFPNWKIGGSVEGRKGCHEGTIWTRGPYGNIDDDAELTSGEVYFPDGSSTSALIGVDSDLRYAWATELRIYVSEDGTDFWRIERGKEGIWHYPKFTKEFSTPLDDSERFPFQYHTHLLSDITGKTISGCVGDGGVHTTWDVSELWE